VWRHLHSITGNNMHTSMSVIDLHAKVMVINISAELELRWRM
jgi:hypothetical protein